MSDRDHRPGSNANTRTYEPGNPVGQGFFLNDLEVLMPHLPDGLCAETDPEAFYPEKGGSTRHAKAVCLECPIQTECLEWAIEHGERYGIWGGTSEHERRKIIAARGITPNRITPGNNYALSPEGRDAMIERNKRGGRTRAENNARKQAS